MSQRDPPLLLHLAETEQEKSEIFHQTNLLLQLANYVGTYKAALLLNDEAMADIGRRMAERKSIFELRANDMRQQLDRIRDAMNLSAQWSQMAARDAVMTVFHFGKTLDSISFKLTPSLAAAVDHKKLRAARKHFQDYFRGNEEARHAVGHAAERLSSTSKTEHITHSAAYESPNLKIAEGASYALSNFTDGDQVVSTVAHPHTGKTSIVKAPFSHEALAELDSITDEVFDTFRSAEAAHRQRPT
jgi:hypothetical protein